MAIPSTISVLMYVRLSAHRRRTALALASLAAGLAAFFLMGLFILQAVYRFYPLA